MNDLDYLRMSKLQKLWYNICKFFRGIPKALLGMLMGILNFFKGIGTGVGNVCKDIVMTYIHGDWKTKVSYTVMGFGSFMRGQWLRGLLFFVFQTAFNLYLWFFGIGYVMKLPTLGTETLRTTAEGATIYGDDSFLIMLYGVLTFFFILAFLYTWYVNVKQNRIAEQILKSGKPLKSAKADVASMLDDQFHKTLLALPVLGVTVFTILPIIFMILVAFTNYDKEHNPPLNLFTWVGFDNFNELLSTEETPLSVTRSVHPDGTVALSVTAKNGDIYNLYVDPADVERVDAAIATTYLPATEFPLELEAGDAWALTLTKQSRGASNLKLVLPNGTEFTFSTDKAQLDNTNAAVDMLKVGGVSGHMTAEGDTGALTLTGADGTAITLNITKVKETPGKDIDAEFAFADRKDDAVTLARKDQTNGTVNITINAEDDVTIAAKVSAEEAAKLTDAEAILTAGGKVRVEQKERTVTNEAGEEAAQAYTVLVFTEGDTELEVEATGVAQTDSRRIIFVSATGEEVDLNIYNLTEVMTPSMPRTFAQVLMWTLIWAFFATFLNYFLGMLVAIMINKKGIKFKKLWRTILVMTIAIPQFISLLYVSKMFAADVLVNGMLLSFFGDGGTLENWIKEVALRFNSEGLYAWADGMKWMAEPLPFWTNANWAKVTIIGINVWIGIPYLMLIATGILMNIPADLYESARIDGANAFQTYMKITLPYMLFVTGPYLLTSFTGNINNFNVIFLLSGGKPTGMGLSGNAGSTDLLITWLYKMTVNDNNYKLAAVLGILVFVVCAVINLVVYNLIPSVKNEEDFQ